LIADSGVTGITVSVGEREAASLREQLASFRPLLTLSTVMASTCDEWEILSIATTAILSVGGCRVEGVYLDDHWWSVGSVGRPADAGGLEAQLASLNHLGGALTVGGSGWAWAYPLTGAAQMAGHLVVSSDCEPEPHHQFLLDVLAQHAGVALVNARLHTRERASITRERKIADQLRAANIALEQAMAELARSSAAVQRSLDIHNRLTAVASAGQGQNGIARCLYELTGLAVAIEDRHGNLTAWAGPGRLEPYPKPSPARREETLRRAVDARAPVRDKGRVIAVSQPGSEILGVIALIDPHRTAGDIERIALEHANTVLSLELAHLQASGEIELRLRRDLVEDLLAGTDPDSARERARALGYDLARPHRVVIVSDGKQRTHHEAFFAAVRRAMRDTGVGSLLTGRPDGVTMLCHPDRDWELFRATILGGIGPQGSCRVAVGAPCIEPSEFPRSYRQAQLALRMQIATGCPEQVTVFDNLGIYQLLSEITEMSTVDEFIHRWLGALIDYDAAKDSQLVDTLAAYLECGGNYDLTAKALSLHRSTLRYRLQRIREMSGHELNDPDTRFNLQLATRAWTTVHALRGLT
jgi:sugar diacid utilization regulator